MIRIRTAVLGLTLVLFALPASAQESVDPRLERIRSNLPAEAVERIETQVQQAIEQGLPVEPLLDKALEGIAKRVPGDRIAGAVGQLSQELGRARSLLAGTAEGPPPASMDVAAVADALRRGVPEPAVQRIARGAGPEEPVALAVHTVGDLLDQGVPTDQAVAAVEAWRERGGGADDLRQMPAAVERLIRQGVLPSHAAAAVTRAMGRAGPPAGGPSGMNGQGPGAGMGQGGGPPTTPPIPPGAGPPDDRGGGPGKGGDKGNGNGNPPGEGPPDGL